jgi:small subunit ribosomal protein S9
MVNCVAKAKKTKKKRKEKKKDYAFETGKRKKAVARAKIEKGSGKITVNSRPLKLWGNEILRLWIKEPLVIAGDVAKGVNITATVKGGGVSGQAEALRVAISRGLVSFSKDKKLRERYLEYDRNLLVYDPRRTEPHKPSRSRKGARRHKQRSKR